MIDYTEVIISICSIIITGILVPILKSKLDKSKREKIEYWVEIGVRWAKQYLTSETGEMKKELVTLYLADKFAELGLKVSVSDVDKIIEAVYERVK